VAAVLTTGQLVSGTRSVINTCLCQALHAASFLCVLFPVAYPAPSSLPAVACCVVDDDAAHEVAAACLVWVAEDWAHKKKTRATLAGLKDLVNRAGKRQAKVCAQVDQKAWGR
jgi:hypothetical protein